MHREFVEGLRWLGGTLLLVGGVSFVAALFIDGPWDAFPQTIMLIMILLLLPGGVALAVGIMLERPSPGRNSDVSSD